MVGHLGHKMSQFCLPWNCLLFTPNMSEIFFVVHNPSLDPQCLKITQNIALVRFLEMLRLLTWSPALMRQLTHHPMLSSKRQKKVGESLSANWCISDLIRVFPLFGTTSKTLWCGHGVMYKVIPLVFTFYCWSLVLVSTHYSPADYCGKSQGFANHRQQGRLGSLFYSFFKFPSQLQNYRQPKIIDGSVSKKDSWPWQVKQ